MLRLRFIAALLLVLLFTACARTGPRTVDLRLPRTGAQSLEFSVAAGQVTVLPSRDGTIHVDVALSVDQPLFGRWTRIGKARAVEQATLDHGLKNGVMQVSLSFPPGTDHDGVAQVWTVEIPPVMHVHAQLGSGQMQISGVAGGVDAGVTAGSLVINIPYGAVHAEVGAGDIDASTHVLDYGPVTLSSGTGQVLFSIDGASAGNVQPQGTGQQLKYQGSGKTELTLAVKTGQVKLALMSR